MIKAAKPYARFARILFRRPVTSGTILIFFSVTILLGLPACTKNPQDGILRAAIGLADYSLSSGPIEVQGVTVNASGLTFSASTSTLFMITNAPAEIHELTSEGQAMRRITLTGFKDTEGITHIRGNSYAIIEERRNTLALIMITPETQEIDRADAQIISLEQQPGGNKGLEGVSFDPLGNRLLVIKERSPRGFYEVNHWDQQGHLPHVEYRRVLPWESLGRAYFSAIHLDPDSNHLLLLSDESGRVEERTQSGTTLGHLMLKRGRSGLTDDVPQAEGLTLAPDGTLYVCSEPNLLYIFKKKPHPLAKASDYNKRLGRTKLPRLAI